MKRKKFNAIFAGIIFLFLLIQFFRPQKDNPTVDQSLDFIMAAHPTENVKIMLKNACYDCHSHETIYPWYFNIAPVSWLLTNDVHQGRKNLNFSTWNNYPDKEKGKNLKKILNELNDNEMPLWYYKPTHPDSRLNEQQKKELIDWFSELEKKSVNINK